jgi:hypothetical protein
MSKEMKEKKNELDVRVYYQSLSRTERGKFLKYLLMRYDYNSRTMSAKLNNIHSLIRRDERENIEKTIETGVWRQ